MPEQMREIGFYTLAGHSGTPRDLVKEAQDAEWLGVGAAFISERFNTKEASVVSGALGAASTQIGIGTAATNHNTRHPIITATMATTMHRLTGGRFALGLGRGFDRQFKAIGLQPITSAQIEDFVGIMRRLWKGERILGHDGPAGKYPYLQQDPSFNEHIPIIFTALGPKSLELAGRCMDGVVLHTYFSDPAVLAAVESVKRGAEQTGRDPAKIRIWSVLATIGDWLPYEKRLLKTVGRFASYLQGYGDLLIQVNGWDPDVLKRFREDSFVKGFQGGFDSKATTAELERIAPLLPEEWLAAAAMGSAEQCAAEVARQFDLGVNGVIMHGASPEEIAPIVEAYCKIRPARFSKPGEGPANPGWGL
jgi:probable F420-dependent oxidoreductase